MSDVFSGKSILSSQLQAVSTYSSLMLRILGITLSPSKCTIWGPTIKSVKLATAVLLKFLQLLCFNSTVFRIHNRAFSNIFFIKLSY